MDFFARITRYLTILLMLFLFGSLCGDMIVNMNASPVGQVVDKYYATNAFNGFYFVVVESESSFFGSDASARFKCEVDPETYQIVCVGDSVSVEVTLYPFGYMFGRGRLVLLD